jgi:hypothetical protein
MEIEQAKPSNLSLLYCLKHIFPLAMLDSGQNQPTAAFDHACNVGVV